MNITWLENNVDTLRLPIHLDNDTDYIKEITERYDKILSAFSGTEAIELTKFTEQIIASVKAYYNSDTIESYDLVFQLMKELSTDSNAELCFSTFEKTKIPKNKSKHSQLFRAREGEPYIEYSADKMGYVPFEQRSKCAANRYSLAGIPCLYLGNTSYVCWLEMNCPSDDRFCVSPYTIDDSLSFFNIALPIEQLYSLLNEDNIDRERFMFLMKIYLLEIATSVHIKQRNRQFNSEYIISQNIMRACKRLKVDGIIFYTTRASDNLMSSVCGYNIALYIDYQEDTNSSSIFDSSTKHGDSVNYAMFKNLLPSANLVKYDLAIYNTGDIPNIGSMKNQISYIETQFHLFDNYVFSHWHEGPLDISRE